MGDDDGDSASTVLVTTTSASHVLDIKGYPKLIKLLPNGKGVASLPFAVQGRASSSSSSWHVEFFPNGDLPARAAIVSLFAVLDRADSAVKATVSFDLLDPATGDPVPSYTSAARDVVQDFTRLGACFPHAGSSIRREELERDFRLLEAGAGSFSVRCIVTVFEFSGAPAVPPPDLPRHLGGLLETRQGADVGFLVGGAAQDTSYFSAHRCVLAARSPVFRAELYGGMAESVADGRCVRVDDMRPEVFGHLLRFAYTDSLPEPSDQLEEQQEDAIDAIAMAQHLMEAADRYGMERLKLACEDTLCRRVGESTVATTLALAEQHGCHRLKETCFRLLLKSPALLNSVMATDDFDHLSKSCPSLLKELMSKLAEKPAAISPPSKRRKTKN